MSAYVAPHWVIICKDSGHAPFKMGGFGSRREAYEFMFREYPNCEFDITWDMEA